MGKGRRRRGRIEDGEWRRKEEEGHGGRVDRAMGEDGERRVNKGRDGGEGEGRVNKGREGEKEKGE